MTMLFLLMCLLLPVLLSLGAAVSVLGMYYMLTK